jgi:hypothetical protein
VTVASAPGPANVAATRRTGGLVAATAVLVAAGCGGGAGYGVTDGTYASRVPSAEQFAADTGGGLPAG